MYIWRAARPAALHDFLPDGRVEVVGREVAQHAVVSILAQIQFIINITQGLYWPLGRRFESTFYYTPFYTIYFLRLPLFHNFYFNFLPSFLTFSLLILVPFTQKSK